MRKDEETLCDLPHFKFSGRKDQRTVHGNRNCREAMEKLYRLFHIEKLLLCGGGGADWSFLDAGMVDELSLVIAPVTDGSQGSASVFAGIPGLNGVSPVGFSLKEVRQTEGGGVYLRCLAKNAK